MSIDKEFKSTHLCSVYFTLWCMVTRDEFVDGWRGK